MWWWSCCHLSENHSSYLLQITSFEYLAFKITRLHYSIADYCPPKYNPTFLSELYELLTTSFSPYIYYSAEMLLFMLISLTARLRISFHSATTLHSMCHALPTAKATHFPWYVPLVCLFLTLTPLLSCSLTKLSSFLFHYFLLIWLIN